MSFPVPPTVEPPADVTFCRGQYQVTTWDGDVETVACPGCRGCKPHLFPAGGLSRTKRLEQLSRRAEGLTSQASVLDDPRVAPLIDVVTEMGRELYRLAVAVEGWT